MTFANVSIQVYQPLLTDKELIKTWPNVTTENVNRSCSALSGAMVVTRAAINGETHLPLPIMDEYMTIQQVKEQMHFLEGALISWTVQIKEQLTSKPDALFEDGKLPAPVEYIDFWKEKSANLNLVCEQLDGPKIQKIVTALDKARSPYLPAFRGLCQEVLTVRAHTNKMQLELSILRRIFDQLKGTDELSHVRSILRPIFHGLMLVWVHGGHLSEDNSGLIFPVQMVCNEVIRQGLKKLEGTEIFALEFADGERQIQAVIDTCLELQMHYLEYKNKASKARRDRPWRVPMATMFERLDLFVERCSEVKAILCVSSQILKLAELEFGGKEGVTITESVASTVESFSATLAQVQSIPYDIFDITESQFETDNGKFWAETADLQKRIATLIRIALDDCHTADAAFKLLDCFNSVLAIPEVRDELEPKLISLLDEYEVELLDVQRVFFKESQNPPIYNNMPPVAGALNWTHGIMDRITIPLERFRELGPVVLETDQYANVDKLYSAITSTFKQYNLGKREIWEKEVGVSVIAKLDQPILRREAGNTSGQNDANEQSKHCLFLFVNFDPELVLLLREVKYFLLLRLHIPDVAMKIYKQADTFRNWTGNLELIVNKYNWCLHNVLEVEEPLIKDLLYSVNNHLNKGITELNWNSKGINDFITNSMAAVQELATTLNMMKENVEKIRLVLGKWTGTPAYAREDLMKMSLIEDLKDDHSTLVEERLHSMTEEAVQIHEILASTQTKIKDIAKKKDAWKLYVEHVNGIIVNALGKTVSNTIIHFSGMLDPAAIKRYGLSPLLEVSLKIEDIDGRNEVIFTPGFGEEEGSDGEEGLGSVFTKFVRDWLNMATCMKRLDTKNGSYMKDVEDSFQVRQDLNTLSSYIMYGESECDNFLHTFLKYRELWELPMVEGFRAFEREFVSSRRPSMDVGSKNAGMEVYEASMIPLEAFDRKIGHYLALKEEIGELPTFCDIAWLRVDSKPIRSQLIHFAAEWCSLFTEHLLNEIHDTVTDAIIFIEETNKILEKEVKAGQDSLLEEVLTAVRDVKVKTDKYDQLVEPLKAKAALLKKYRSAPPEETISALEALPASWESTKNNMLDTKDRLNPLHLSKGAEVKASTVKFCQKLSIFRHEVLDGAPFKYDREPESAYLVLQEYVVKLQEYETEGDIYVKQCQLFELKTLDMKELRDCSSDLVLLKSVWDAIAMTTNMFEDWKTTLWESIDTDILTDETKRLREVVRKLDKKTREWGVYKGVDTLVNDMLLSLPLIQMLKSQSMRERHWDELKEVTDSSFTLDSNFCLADLIELNLHKCVEDVENVVIKSQKELNIEKNLTKIADAWEKLQLSYEPYAKDDAVMLVKVSEEVVEAYEEHQLILQGMSSSKYIPVFQSEVNAWLSKLGAVESVTTIWGTIQQKWVQLESIFIGSDDIRAQLPEDSKRFDIIDQDFKELQGESQHIPNTVEACNREDVFEKLEKMEGMLDLCQKALDEYLGTKKSAFPRFYFVAAQDLIDILSKGSNPFDIQHHISKCFDNIDNLKFDAEQIATGKSNTAHGMFSSEMEYVEFHEPFVATGAVEIYMANLVKHHCTTMKGVIKQSLGEYTSKGRATWMMKYCCQAVLVGSMIWWNMEVVTAFNQLEDGMETALKDQWQRQVDQLLPLAAVVRGDLDKGDRRKIVTLMTIDVHARDVVDKLVKQQVENSACFEWLSQLRISWDETLDTVICDIADAKFIYGYEYVGNCGRLVMTPLTDRCYITLTQALRLKMGGAPAGPAGTGKTETTKDLARTLGIICYVFNCSEQMNSGVMGNIFKGLSASGSWGCFDEFNRIAIEVLSVVATQFRCVLMGIRSFNAFPVEHVTCGKFNFDGEDCELVPTAMGFITMNPGYAGRTELPENVKALFRSVAMIVPDMEMICEIMLFAEGFGQARTMARKFMMLFRLNKDLLSVQIHYDWGLRAVKSILVIAGSLKRADPDVEEDGVLMRALRDCNLTKLVIEDVDVFMGLVKDLFPGYDLPRKRDLDVETSIKQICAANNLQPVDDFITKIVSLAELFEVRHSVFVIGAPGSGKSTIWRTLADNQSAMGSKTIFETMNPKAQTSNELFGYIHPVVGWKDGIFSFVMRNYAQMDNPWWKWIVLDGEVDPEWIESLNTVMDDNKVLTLASNERVPLTPTMRLVIEVANLKNANPSTVSRGGVLFINERDIGWKPFVDSWIYRGDREKSQQEALKVLFQTYIGNTMDFFKRNIRPIVPVQEINMMMTTCFLLDSLLEDYTEVPKKILNTSFAFASIWGFGSALSVDKGVDYRILFSDHWKSTWSDLIKFEGDRSVFDYRIDPATGELKGWEGVLKAYAHTPEIPFYNITVPTVDSVRLTYLVDMLAKNQHPVMLIGLAGTGKTTVAQEKLRKLESDEWSYAVINQNSHTDALSLQLIIEQSIEKRAGKTYTPIGNKRHIFFIDDLNMPSLDKYGTQSPIELLCQLVDLKFLFDRNKCGVVKEVQGVQYLAAMNPTAGSFQINGRLQRQFGSFACQLPTNDAIETIYLSILNGHMKDFEPSVANMASNLVAATILLHGVMLKDYLPNAIKFHYQWNLRELSNVFYAFMDMKPQHYSDPAKVARLWSHEVSRVYGDRLTVQDFASFDSKVDTAANCSFEGFDVMEAVERPNIFCTFWSESDDPVYLAVPDQGILKAKLEEKLEEYNEMNAVMQLVLFGTFMEHVCRLDRIISKPRGNAMLVGVGGSGKQSLTRLVSFISQYSTFSISLTGSYNLVNLQEDMMMLYKRAGVKGEQITWLLVDNQIVDDSFLVYINDFLSSGYIPNLFVKEDKDDVINGVRNEVKAEGIVDTNDNCWEYFLEKVRKNLHLVFCMSPVGEKFRIWCRNFPALISCAVIDWVHDWPAEALCSVASRFLESIDVKGGEDMMKNISDHCAFVHLQVMEMNKKYFAFERRYNYATPKSFLELIDLYKRLFGTKMESVGEELSQLESGLQKLNKTEEDVLLLGVRLQEEAIVVEEKKTSTLALLEKVGKETSLVEVERGAAQIENEKASAEREESTKIRTKCDSELEKAEPLVLQALAALDVLNKDAIGELKGFSTPPSGIEDVVSCVIYLMSPHDKLAKDVSFKAGKQVMKNPKDFVSKLKAIDIDNIPRDNVAAVKSNALFKKGMDPKTIGKKSKAAGGLCTWVVNIVAYDDVYQMITPLRGSLEEATVRLEKAEKDLEVVTARVDKLEKQLSVLTDQFEKATEEKNTLIANQKKTALMLVMAERLVAALKDEKIRWGENVVVMREKIRMVTGDTLGAAAFVSYLGPFSMRFRKELMDDFIIPDLKNKGIPSSEIVDPMDTLTDTTKRALWSNEGLPSDPLSMENAAILTTCSRWPLIIDPQLQGITWIKSHEAANDVKSISLSTHKFLILVERAITMGNPLIIENLAESIDPVLDPVVARSVVKKGSSFFIKIGDNDDVEYDKKFRLYLQTKMPNPHYQPEVAAQTTLINFTVTEQGLEEQLLAEVVLLERPDLEAKRAELIRQQNEFTKTLKDLEAALLYKLSKAEGNIVEDVELIENLENAKVTAAEVEEKSQEAKVTEATINSSRETYRPAAARSSLIYFVLNQLWIIDHMYQYSLGGFMRVFLKAVQKSEPSEEVETRVQHIITNVTYSLFSYASRGLFSRHKLVFASQLCFRIMNQMQELDKEQFEFLIRCPKTAGTEKPPELEWLTDGGWGAIQSLTELEGFNKFAEDMIGNPKRFQEWAALEACENEKLPMEYKSLLPLQRLLVIRCLRPDRMTMAMEGFVGEYMGKDYVSDVSAQLELCLEETDPSTPVYFILSPGFDVVAEVERAAAKRDLTASNGMFMDISLGEGKDVIANVEVDRLCKDGGWIILQNIHLMPRWLLDLEKRIERNSLDANPDFRIFFTSDPSKMIPVALLQRSVKLTQEPPPGLKALFKRSWDMFDESTWDNSTRATDCRQILFALSFFHSIMIERRKFGPQGWNRIYPFAAGDLTVCKDVTLNYLESSGTHIPWEDLKYIFGEIMYGGHITDFFDRILCCTYLEKYMSNDLLEGLELYPGFRVPTNSGHAALMEYIDEMMGTESPMMFGLHSNTEIGFRTEQSESLFTTLVDLQPRTSEGGSGGTVQEKVIGVMDTIKEDLHDSVFDMNDLLSRIEDETGRTPFVNVFYQECGYMNTLIIEIQKSLEILRLGIRGELQMSDAMEVLMNSLYNNNVPQTWMKLGFASMRQLASWLSNLKDRVKQLSTWVIDLGIPNAIWISGFFNPQSFLTAVMQTQARANNWALDRVVVMTEVTKKMGETDVDAPCPDGSYIYGLYIEGARWDMSVGAIAEARMKEMFFKMPVIIVKAVQVEKAEYNEVYMCPVYKTQVRGPTYVFTADLTSRTSASDWVIGGVALLMDVVL